MIHDVILPEGWPRPSGYANGVVAMGKQVFVAGQIGWDAEQRILTGDFIAQTRQALRNVVAVLAAADALPEHMTRMTWYVTNMELYRSAGAELGRVYREVMGANYPAMSAVSVTALVEREALVEIEVTAIVPRID